jgi:hypothetical protein
VIEQQKQEYAPRDDFPKMGALSGIEPVAFHLA